MPASAAALEVGGLLHQLGDVGDLEDQCVGSVRRLPARGAGQDQITPDTGAVRPTEP